MDADATEPYLAGPFETPYYAVVFSSVRSNGDHQAYAETAARMEGLAREQPGFLGFESAREASGVGVTVSYWRSLEAVRAWRDHAEHAETQRLGRERWYADYRVRVCRVESDRLGP